MVEWVLNQAPILPDNMVECSVESGSHAAGHQCRIRLPRCPASGLTPTPILGRPCPFVSHPFNNSCRALGLSPRPFGQPSLHLRPNPALSLPGSCPSSLPRMIGGPHHPWPTLDNLGYIWGDLEYSWDNPGAHLIILSGHLGPHRATLGYA